MLLLTPNSYFLKPINGCESFNLDRSHKKRLRLPRPVRHERGEGRGEGSFIIPSDPIVQSSSSPPFRPEVSEPEGPGADCTNILKD